jgi:hypothetical protein
MVGLIWTIIVILAIAWFLGFAVNIGWWIHLLLIIALIGIVYNLVIGPMLLASRAPARDHTHGHAHDHDHYHDPEI